MYVDALRTLNSPIILEHWLMNIAPSEKRTRYLTLPIDWLRLLLLYKYQQKWPLLHLHPVPFLVVCTFQKTANPILVHLLHQA